MLREARENKQKSSEKPRQLVTQWSRKSKTLAEAEGLKLLDEAKAQIQVEKANALRDIRSQVADLSVQVAEKIIRQQLSNDTERTNYINGLLDDIEKQ